MCVLVLFSSVIRSLGEARDCLYASSELVCLFCMRYFLSVFCSSWCNGSFKELAALVT